MICKKICHSIFDYNTRISWWIFTPFVPIETGNNKLQFIYSTAL